MSMVFTVLPLVMLSAQPLPVSLASPNQAIAQGWTLDRLQQAYDRMCAPPLSDLDFVMSDVNFKLTRRYTEYSGDISGRLLQSLMAAGAAIGRDSAMVSTVMALMGQYQKADGHFGTEQDLAVEIKPERDMPILWGNSRLLLAFTMRYEQTKDAEAMKLARGIGDYVISTRPYLGKPENLKLGGSYASGYTTCYPALIEGMARLAEVSGEMKYLDEARHIARVALQDKSFEAHHSHGRLAAYRGMLEIDHVAKTSEFLEAVKAGVATVNAEFILPTGGVTEMFDRLYPMDEGCSEVDWIMTNVYLWRATGDTTYLDSAEFALRNHLLATQFSNGGFGHHNMKSLRVADKKWPGSGIANVGAEAYWCCAEHGTQLLGDLTKWAVLSDGESVYVSFLVEARATMIVQNRQVRVSVKEPQAGKWEVEVSADAGPPVMVKLRVPRSQGGLMVDGQMAEGKNGWVTKSVSVQPAVKLTVRFSEKVLLLGPYSEAKVVDEPLRIVVGCDLYCLPDVSVPDGFVARDKVPTVCLAAERANEAEVPVLVEGGKGGIDRIRTRLVPIMQRPRGGCACLFNVKKATEKEIDQVREFKHMGVPVELLLACEAENEVFLNGKPVGKRRMLGRFELWADRTPIDIAVKTKSNSKRPELMGVVSVGGKSYTTDAAHWTVRRCPAVLPADWFVAEGRDRDSQAKALDIGGVGEGSTKLIYAEFMGTGARWIGPEADERVGEQNWLFSSVIEVNE